MITLPIFYAKDGGIDNLSIFWSINGHWHWVRFIFKNWKSSSYGEETIKRGDEVQGFVDKVMQAYNRFLEDKTPFAVIKIGFNPELSSGGHIPQKEIYEAVRQNFRGEDYVVSAGRQNRNCAILLQGSSLDKAIAAASRMVYKACSLASDYSTQALEHGLGQKVQDIPDAKIEIWAQEQGVADEGRFAKFNFKDIYNYVSPASEKLPKEHEIYMKQQGLERTSANAPGSSGVPPGDKQIDIRV